MNRKSVDETEIRLVKRDQNVYHSLEEAEQAYSIGQVGSPYHLTFACAAGKWDIAAFLVQNKIKITAEAMLEVAAGGNVDLMNAMCMAAPSLLNRAHLLAAYKHYNESGVPEANVAMTELVMNFGVAPNREDLLYAIHTKQHALTTVFLNGRGLIADNEHVVNACFHGDEIVIKLLLSQEQTIHIHNQAPLHSVIGFHTSPFNLWTYCKCRCSSCDVCNNCCKCKCSTCDNCNACDGCCNGCFRPATIVLASCNAFDAAAFKYNSSTLMKLLHTYAQQENRRLNHLCGRYCGPRKHCLSCDDVGEEWLSGSF